MRSGGEAKQDDAMRIDDATPRRARRTRPSARCASCSAAGDLGCGPVLGTRCSDQDAGSLRSVLSTVAHFRCPRDRWRVSDSRRRERSTTAAPVLLLSGAVDPATCWLRDAAQPHEPAARDHAAAMAVVGMLELRVAGWSAAPGAVPGQSGIVRWPWRRAAMPGGCWALRLHEASWSSTAGNESQRGSRFTRELPPCIAKCRCDDRS